MFYHFHEYHGVLGCVGGIGKHSHYAATKLDIVLNVSIVRKLLSTEEKKVFVNILKD